MRDKKEKLKKKVIWFLQDQPGYTNREREKLRISFENKELYKVMYGKDEMAGITGCGATVDLAFDEFVKRWTSLKGFEWIEKNK